MSVKIDHVVIAGSDLTRLVNAFESIGLTPDPGGVHADGQTHNALIGFGDGSYLELIAPVPGGNAEAHEWGEFMRSNAGVCAWAIRSDDIDADAAEYRARGIAVSEFIGGGRTRPDGVRLDWIKATLGNETLGAVLPFLIQDVTSRENRVPRTASANGIIGITEVLAQVSVPLQQEWLDINLSLPVYTESLDHLNSNAHSHRSEGMSQGVYGVVLAVTDSAAAQKRYGWDNKIFRVWRDQNSFWPVMTGIVMAITGESV